MATPNYSWQNKFTTTLSSGVTATDTTIPLTTLPTPSEGTIILEPDSSTAWEEIYYTSKTGSAIVCPSVAAGRGQNGSSAASHSNGATVRMDSAAGMFLQVQDGTALTGIHTNNSNYGFDFVASGCVWSGDSYGASLNGSMTSGVLYINGRRHTMATITAHAFTASKDTYIDALYSTVDNIATPVYTEVSNNAASPALAANSVRIAIIQSGVTITAVGAVNQGQETKVLPIASSIPYTTTDSLGNLICPRDPQRRILGYRQITTNFTTASATQVQVTGLTCPVIIPANRKVIVTGYCYLMDDTGSATMAFNLWSGVVVSGTQLESGTATKNGTNLPIYVSVPYTSSTASVTFNVGASTSTGTLTITAAGTAPAYVLITLA